MYEAPNKITACYCRLSQEEERVGESPLSVVWICLGSTFLCLGAVRKQNKDKKARK